MRDETANGDAADLSSTDEVSKLAGSITSGTTEDRVTAAYELDEWAETNPEAVVEVLPALRTALAADDEPVRAAVAVVFSTISASTPPAVAPAADELAALVSDSEPTANNALSALVALLNEEPETVLSALEPSLDALVTTAREGTPIVSQRATRVLVEFARSRPGKLTEIDAGPSLVDLLERSPSVGHEPLPGATTGGDQRFSEFVGRRNRETNTRRQTTRQLAIAAIHHLATECPGAFDGQFQRLIAHVDDDDPAVRAGVVRCTRWAASVTPSATQNATSRLVDLLFDEAESERIRAEAATALGLLSEEAPDAVAEAVAPNRHEFDRLLATEDDALRGSVVGLLAYVSERDPGVAEATRDHLLSGLDDERSFVRGNAALALGYVGGADVRSELSRLRRSDPAESVRRSAADAIDRLESGD